MKIKLVKKVDGDFSATYHEVLSGVHSDPVVIGTVPINKRTLETLFGEIPKTLVLTIDKGEDE